MIAAAPLADLEDLIRFGWPSRYLIQIAILFTVFPLIFFLDGQESEKRREEKRPGTPSLTLLGGMIPPRPLQKLEPNRT
jgi:hypothetical protein